MGSGKGEDDQGGGGSEDSEGSELDTVADPHATTVDEEAGCPGEEPQRIGKYVVQGTLGRGGMGTVYKGYDRNLHRTVALKVLHAKGDDDGLGGPRLKREAQALAKLAHPNVVRVYEVDDDDGQPFVAMELVEGQTLRSWQQLSDSPRPWSECVEVYIQAGQGLAAAHTQGIVHRDFKPGNAILDEEGRARVLDFGLARRTDIGEDEPARFADTEKYLTLDRTLTRTGFFRGTPAYMSPEQTRGREVDGRSDQFSFCVALYEAVYGERPFRGRSVPAVVLAIQRGEIRPAPKGSPVPTRLRRVLLRGLRTDPAERWPSMDALLEQLRRLLVPRRRWPTVVALAVIVGALVVGRLSGGAVEVCIRDESVLSELWGDERKDAVQSALEDTALPYAVATWERVEEQLDAYVEAWDDAHLDACEATNVRREQSAEAMDLRMACLDERAMIVGAVVEVLAGADAGVVDNATELVMGLPELSRCDDVDLLRAAVPPPEDPRVAERVAVVRRRLSELDAVGKAGRAKAALESIGPIMLRAEESGYAPLVAEARLLRGRLQKDDGQYALAERDLAEAFELAVEHGHDEVALGAALGLVYVVGHWQGRYAEAAVWSRSARARARHRGNEIEIVASLSAEGMLLRAQDEYERAADVFGRALEMLEQLPEPDPLQLATLLMNVATVERDRGRIEQSLLHLERVLEVREDILDSGHPDVAQVLKNMGDAYVENGEYDVAVSLLVRALRITEDARGTEHPTTANYAEGLGGAHMQKGEYARAQELYERALRSRESSFGADHLYVSWSLNNLGALSLARGDLEEAIVHLERSLRIKEKAYGTEHSSVATALHNLGGVRFEQGQYDQAALDFDRALRIRRKTLGAKHPAVARTTNNLALVYFAQGSYERARLYYDEALAIWEESLGKDHPDVGFALVGLADAELIRGRTTEAIGYAERAVSVYERGKIDPAELAHARFALARALWADPSERPRALDEANRARRTLEGAEDARELAKVTQWLSEHDAKGR